MAILLIKDSDARMPTVAEWRKWMTDVEIPKAQQFFTDHPGCGKALADRARLEDYEQAKSVLSAHLEGKQVLNPTDLLEVNARISAYEAKPLNETEWAAMVEHHRPMLDGSTPGEKDRRKWRGPSLADQYRYHKGQMEVEAVKPDMQKATELAEKDRRGCYKLGDVVQVFEDGTKCVIPPQPPFFIVEITGLSKAQAEKYAEPEMDTADRENPIMTRRRKLGIPVSDLPAMIRTALMRDRYVKVAWTQVRGYMRNKLTGVGE